ncbi:OstA-like protein [Mesonia maritima]|uniref:Lipopolysaccharide export system protein LptA n=1 Tax=Mesonia maritima TaxID=1793873 RepID=A0ABU1K499_9FLAO|nr:OstA-like protein [Mesonia maritima]MDR6300434.1 lipopolysaccharide export system protein LptA [Mesonia maritima]
MKNLQVYIFFAFTFFALQLQAQKKIDYDSERTIKNEEKYPGALIFSKVNKQVYFTHEGIEVWCDQAIFYQKDDFFKAFGNVRMQQGDTVTLTSKYAEYDGNTQFAFASNNVKLSTPSNTLTTDTLFFDRKKQESFYRSGGTVKDTASTIKSVIGRYFMQDEKYSFVNDVVVTNKDYIINSQQLDFYTNTGHAYLYGPSTITSENSKVYCERGFYDTRNDKGYFVKNSTVYYENRKLEGDSIFFDQTNSFASATNNIKVTDTANSSVVKGHYAEVFRAKDSVFITKRAVASMKQEQDSIHIHSDTLMITGKTKKRVIRGFYDTRIYKTNMSGKCDSIHIDEPSGLTQMLGKPVVWSGNNQLTGDTIHLLNDTITDKLDSLKVFYDAFMIQKDSIKGFNQVKGKEMYGLFNEENELSEANFIKNTETIYYSRDEEKNLIGIDKMLSSSIKILFEDRAVTNIYYYNNPEGDMMLPENFPENARKLRGFNWRGDEQLTKKSDLFLNEPPLKLPKIKGIPLPEEEDTFFDEKKEGDDPLLNEKSRLTPEKLQHQSKENEEEKTTLQLKNK